jgi:release factor glutamine methyltransferase
LQKWKAFPMLKAALPGKSFETASQEDAEAAIRRLSAEFTRHGLESPSLDARLLVLNACGLTHEAYVVNAGRALKPAEAEAIDAMRRRRLNGEPVSRIIGRREFWGLDFLIDEAVLDPRPDTETLVQAALDIIREEGLGDDEFSLADLGAGSGCILLSILSELPRATGVGIDISSDARVVAANNAGRLGLASRAVFMVGNWCDALGDGFANMIVTNPPYIETEVIRNLAPEVRLYDPAQALDGGRDGLDAYRAIAEGSLRALKPGGWILLEAGAGQAEAVISIFEDSPWRNHIAHRRIDRDLNGIDRLVALKRQE